MTSSSSCTEVLAELGADINKPDDFGETPLHCACSTGREDNVARLLSAGAAANTINHRGRTPLMSAVVGGSALVVQMLLQHDVDMETIDIDGESAATLALWTNRYNILRELTLTGRARLEVITSSGRIILHTAAQYGDVCMVETFLDLPIGTSQSAAVDHDRLIPDERLRERKDLTQELTEVSGALMLKSGAVLVINTRCS
jgi:ankyrin repeat protein